MTEPILTEISFKWITTKLHDLSRRCLTISINIACLTCVTYSIAVSIFLISICHIFAVITFISNAVLIFISLVDVSLELTIILGNSKCIVSLKTNRTTASTLLTVKKEAVQRHKSIGTETGQARIIYGKDDLFKSSVARGLYRYISDNTLINDMRQIKELFSYE